MLRCITTEGPRFSFAKERKLSKKEMGGLLVSVIIYLHLLGTTSSQFPLEFTLFVLRITTVLALASSVRLLCSNFMTNLFLLGQKIISRMKVCPNDTSISTL